MAPEVHSHQLGKMTAGLSCRRQRAGGRMQGLVSGQDTDGSAPAFAPKRERVGAIRSELSPETLRLYAGAWARFVQFRAEHGMAALPARPETVIAFLVQPGRRRTVLARDLAAIDHQHRQRGIAPPERGAKLRAALRSARQAAPRIRKNAAPTPAHLHCLARSCPGDLAGQRDRAMLLLDAAGLGRAALVGLQAEQLRFSEYGVRHEGSGVAEAHQVGVARSAVAAFCPVRALEDWLRASATRYGPVFRKVNRWASSSTPASALMLSG